MMLTTLPPSEQSGPIGYRAAGTGAPLVLLHGVGMQSATWAPQLAALSSSHRVIALDLPGHGISSPLPASSELPDFVVWAAEAIGALGFDRVSLAGHSMGALVAAGLSVSRPDLVERVALLNGVFRRDAAARDAVKARSAQIGTGTFDVETPLDRWFGAGSESCGIRASVAAWLRAVDLGGYATAYSAFARGDDCYADGFGRIRCPLLALTGDLDLNSTPAMSHAMAAAAPMGQAVIVEGHGHMVNLTAPEKVNAALADWLETCYKRENVACQP